MATRVCQEEVFDCDKLATNYNTEIAKFLRDSTSEFQVILKESWESHMRDQSMLFEKFSRKIAEPPMDLVAVPPNASAPSSGAAPTDASGPEHKETPKHSLLEGLEASAEKELLQLQHNLYGDVEEVFGNGEAKEEAEAKEDITYLRQSRDSAIVKIAEAYEEIEKEYIVQRQASHTRKMHNRCDKFAESIRFDFIVGGIIAVNVLVMLAELEYEGRMLEDNVYQGTDVATHDWVDSFFAVSEHVFTAFFAFELVFRLSALGWTYLYDKANIFDAGIVIVCSLDAWVFKPMKSTAMSNTAMIRVLRLVRLSKVFRVLRLMKAFAALRVLMAAILNSIGALLWSMTLLFVFELVGALLMARIVQPYIRDEGENENLRVFLWEHFGTCFQAYISLFELTMWPGAVAKYRRLYDEVNAVLAFFFVGYSILVTFAVVRVITAMFLKATLAAATADEGKMKDIQRAERGEYVTLLKKAMKGTTPNGDMLSRQEFLLLNELPRMAMWLEEAGMEPLQQQMLFDALVTEGRVSYSEFLHAVERMSRPYIATDLVIELYQSRRLLSEMLTAQSARAEPSQGTKLAKEKPQPQTSAESMFSAAVATPGVEVEVIGVSCSV